MVSNELNRVLLVAAKTVFDFHYLGLGLGPGLGRELELEQHR